MRRYRVYPNIKMDTRHLGHRDPNAHGKENGNE
jgi:hypothetical protein